MHVWVFFIWNICVVDLVEADQKTIFGSSHCMVLICFADAKRIVWSNHGFKNVFSELKTLKRNRYGCLLLLSILVEFTKSNSAQFWEAFHIAIVPSSGERRAGQSKWRLQVSVRQRDGGLPLAGQDGDSHDTSSCNSRSVCAVLWNFCNPTSICRHARMHAD